MSQILLPQRFLSQPQYVAPVHKEWVARGLVSALVFDNTGRIVDRVSGSGYTVTGAVARPDRSGKTLHFDGTGDYVNTGVQTLGGVNLFADSTSQWSVVICARLESSADTGTLIAKCGAVGGSRTFQMLHNTGASEDPAVYIRGSLTPLGWGFKNSSWHQ